MKIRKSFTNQKDFLSDDNGRMQWAALTFSTHEQVKLLLSQLLLSTVYQNEQHTKDDHHVKN